MNPRFRALLILMCISAVSLTGCAASSETNEARSVNEQAASEATAIIQRAEATAMVLQAQAKATALIQNAGSTSAAPATAMPTAVPPAFEMTRVPASTGMKGPAIKVRATPGITSTDKTSLPQVELLGVSLAAEGNYIYVPFRAPPGVARKWRQGNVSVADEATGIVYDGIPVQPLIGPLMAHPIHDGQIGYVMFVNTDSGIHNGSIVTVVLGDFKQEHVIVQGDN